MVTLIKADQKIVLKPIRQRHAYVQLNVKISRLRWDVACCIPCTCINLWLSPYDNGTSQFMDNSLSEIRFRQFMVQIKLCRKRCRKTLVIKGVF